MRKLLVFVFVFVSLYSYSQSVCGGLSTTLQATNPLGLVGPSYSLNPGGFPDIGNGQFVVSPTTTTTYTLYTTGQHTNSSIVTTSAVVQVTVFAQPSSVPQFTPATCTNSNNAINLGLTFNPSTPVPGYTITWDPVPMSVLSPQQFTATNLTPGPHSVTITTAGGCSTVVNFTMLPQPAPAAFSVTPFGSTHSITCVQQTVNLTASNPNLTYTWTGSAFSPVISNSISLTSTHLGLVTLVGLNPTTGCSSTHTFQLVQNVAIPSSTLSTNLINITCSQTMAPTLSVTASPSVNISNLIYSPQGGTFVATSYTTIYNIGGPGVHTCVARDESNGCETVKHFTVNSSDHYPTYNVISPNNFTIGCTTTGIATVNIVDAASTIPPGGGGTTFTLMAPSSSTVVAPGLLSTNPTWTVNEAGTWTVIVRDNTNQCETKTPISILQNTFTPHIRATAPQDVLDCNTPSVVLVGTSETPNVGYTWSFQGVPGNVQSPTVNVNINLGTPAATLINNYTLTVTDMGNTCRSTTVITMKQNTAPPITSITSQFTPSITCQTPTITLTNQSRTGITAFSTVQPISGFLWQGPTPQEPLQVSSSYVAGTAGVYTLTAKDMNNGCVSQGTFNVGDNRIYPTITPQNPPAIIDCGAAATDLRPTYTGGAGTPTTVLTYSWSGPNVVGQNTLGLFTVQSPGSYTVVVTNTVNQCKTTSVITAVNGSLTADFNASALTGYAPLTVTFTNLSASSTNTLNIRSMWIYGNGSTSHSAAAQGTATTPPPGLISSSVSPTATYEQPGTYKVVMYSVKGFCLDTAEKYIRVEVPSALEVPNVFTPNGDGVNDLFFLKAKNLVEINMTIFDRWGNIIYEINSLTGNVAWDGKNGQGADASEGTYFYVLKAVGEDNEVYDQKGTISLIR
jgi:gliding motility-associated-like protein